MDLSYVDRNRAAQEKLRLLVAHLSADALTRVLDGEWIVSAVLAHLAFWDRFVLARWEEAQQRSDLVPPAIPDEVQELVNAAAMEEWRSLPSSVAVQGALDAARAIDEMVEALSPAAIAAVLAAGRLGLLDRSHHREEHFDQIERELGRSG